MKVMIIHERGGLVVGHGLVKRKEEVVLIHGREGLVAGYAVVK